MIFDCWDTLLADDEGRGREQKKIFRPTLAANGFTLSQNEIEEIFKEEARLFQNYIIKNRKTQDSRERAETILTLTGCRRGKKPAYDFDEARI